MFDRLIILLYPVLNLANLTLEHERGGTDMYIKCIVLLVFVLRENIEIFVNRMEFHTEVTLA
jgi:hypothetical protein